MAQLGGGLKNIINYQSYLEHVHHNLSRCRTLPKSHFQRNLCSKRYCSKLQQLQPLPRWKKYKFTDNYDNLYSNACTAKCADKYHYCSQYTFFYNRTIIQNKLADPPGSQYVGIAVRAGFKLIGPIAPNWARASGGGRARVIRANFD